MKACVTCGQMLPVEPVKAGIKQFGVSPGCCRCGCRTKGLYGIYVLTAMQPACQDCADQAVKAGEYVERNGRQVKVQQVLPRRALKVGRA